jgi:hypothetical protein
MSTDIKDYAVEEQFEKTLEDFFKVITKIWAIVEITDRNTHNGLRNLLDGLADELMAVHDRVKDIVKPCLEEMNRLLEQVETPKKGD